MKREGHAWDQKPGIHQAASHRYNRKVTYIEKKKVKILRQNIDDVDEEKQVKL